MEKLFGYMNKHFSLSEKLGFDRFTKLLIIHADDAGLSQAENEATIECLKRGSVSSYSIMAPCPRFEQIAVFAKENSAYDYGIHLTLTCEWQSYRFGPVLSVKEVPSLVDADGFFFKSRNELLQFAKPEEIEAELTAQIEKCLRFGLSPTHLDSHMYSLGISDDTLRIYQYLGDKYRLPIMLNKQLINEISGNSDFFIDPSKHIEVDKVILGNYEIFKNGGLESFYENSLHDLNTGLNLLLIHPAYHTSEMKTITVNHPNFGAEWRQIDFDFFSSKKCQNLLKKNNIQMISWKQIKALLYD